MTGERVGAAEVAGEHGNDELPVLVEYDDGRIGFLRFEMRGDQPDERTERKDSDNGVDFTEQTTELIARLAGVGLNGAGRFPFRLCTEFLGDMELRAGQGVDDLAAQRNAVAGDGDDGDLAGERRLRSG